MSISNDVTALPLEQVIARIKATFKPNLTYMALAQGITRAIQPTTFETALTALDSVMSEPMTEDRMDALHAVRTAVYWIKERYRPSNKLIEIQAAYWDQIDIRRPLPKPSNVKDLM